MADYNRNNAPNGAPNNDPTGEVISWVVILILMFAFWPVGLFLLFRKLRGYAKPSGYKANAQGQAGGGAQNAYYGKANAQGQAGGGAQTGATQVSQAAGMMRDAALKAGEAARRAAFEAGVAARRAMGEAGETVRRNAAHYADHAKQVREEVYNDVAREFSKASSGKQEKKKERTPLERKSGRFVSVILLIISIALLIIGANSISKALQALFSGAAGGMRDFIMGAFYFVGAFISFFSRNIGVRRFGRYKKYYAFVAERGLVTIHDIALGCGQPGKTVRRDLQAMINDGYFGPGAYIDSELDSLVLYPEAASEARTNARGDRAAQSTPQNVEEKPENQYMAIILELRGLNETIEDIPISDKIDRIEALTAKIFRIVEENPEKLPQIRRFMNYYLPTTLKLLRSYSTLEKQGIKGENISSAKENIGRILDTLATGYEQQLDQLFESDVIDIAADINVLESLMQQDGLTAEKPELKVMESASW